MSVTVHLREITEVYNLWLDLLLPRQNVQILKTTAIRSFMDHLTYLGMKKYQRRQNISNELFSK